MMKKTELVLALLGISVVLCLLTPGIQAAPSYTVGDLANKVATYSYSGNMSSWQSPTTIHFRTTSGSIVTYNRDSYATDIALNVSQILSYTPWWCVSTGMALSDRFQADNPNYLVNAIVTKNFGGQSWTAVRLNSSVGGVYINALFDQTTGLMLYFNYTFPFSEIVMIFTLQSFGAEAATPIDPAWIIMMAIAGIGISILIASRKMTLRSAKV